MPCKLLESGMFRPASGGTALALQETMLPGFARFALLSALLLPACGESTVDSADDSSDDPADQDNPDPGSACVQTEPIALMGDPPDLLLVVDRSQSMADRLGFFAQKWGIMKNALSDVIINRGDQIHFGLMLFPAQEMCGAGSVSVAPTADTSAGILAALQLAQPGGATPTHTSLQAASDFLSQNTTNPAGQYVLLATDGLPNCNPTYQDESTAETIAAVEALYAQGVPTYVLGFGTDGIADPDALQAMAQAGGTGDYFAANTPDDLSTALEAIAQNVSIPSCDFRLDTEIANPDALVVLLDGQAIDSSEFLYDAAQNSVEILGQACEQIRGGQVDTVTIDRGCIEPECSEDSECSEGESCESGVCTRPID
jgi:hypothetical protein